MRAPRGEAIKRQLLKVLLPKMAPPTLAPFGVWEVTGGGGGVLHGVVVAVHEGGVEVTGTNVSKSTCEKLRKWGVVVTVHTSPSHCNQKSCLSIAARVLLSHLQHPMGKWP